VVPNFVSFVIEWMSVFKDLLKLIYVLRIFIFNK